MNGCNNNPSNKDKEENKVEQTSEFHKQDVLQSGVEATKLVTRQSELTEQARNITQLEKEKQQMKEGTVIQ